MVVVVCVHLSAVLLLLLGIAMPLHVAAKPQAAERAHTKPAGVGGG